MKIRILATLGLLLALAPAASAATITTYDNGSKTLTLDNDADNETFAATIDFGDLGASFEVTATNANIPLDDSTCSNEDGGKTIVCEADDNVDRLVINGGNGNDTVNIGGEPFYGGNFAAHGQDGNDTLAAGPGGSVQIESVTGGPGNDTFLGSPTARDGFRAEAGDDFYNGGTAPIPPGSDPDGFQRYSYNDFWAPAGDTPISISVDNVANDADGQGGTDDVREVEVINGTEGNDTLIAGPDGSALRGNEGDDTLVGSPQSDSLSGEEGNDTLRGLAGDDDLDDGDRDDVSRVNSDPPDPVGDDTLDGGEGEDRLDVATGKDDVIGGPGTDTLITTRFATQVFESTIPTDLQPRHAPVSISLNDQPDDGITGANEGDNVRADVENVTIGSDFGLMVLRSLRGFNVAPAPAPDTVTGSAAANVIVTGGGNDKIEAGAGPDRVDAGSGDDMVNAVDQATDTIICGRGADSVGADLPGTNPGRADLLTDCESVTGTPLGLEGGALPDPPTVTVGGPSTVKVKKFLRSYTVTNEITTDQPATVAGELTIAGAKVAKTGDLTLGTGKLASGVGTRKLKVKVAVRYRKAIKRKLKTKRQRRRGIKLKLAATVTNSAGQATKRTRTIRVKG